MALKKPKEVPKLPKVQAATAEIDFEDLFGKYTLNIIKQDGSFNSAVLHFNIFKKEIALIKEFLPQKKNNGKFCTFGIDKSMYSFSNEFALQ